jgi:hypothetical protein
MAAIAEELLVAARSTTVRNIADDAPEVSVTEAPAGRETLALMAEGAEPIRAEQTTLSYGDRISNAPGAKTPSLVPMPPRGLERSPSRASAPEISIGESALGRDTMALITAELVPAARDGSAPGVASEPDSRSIATPRIETRANDPSTSEARFAIFEMLTFVVQGPEAASLSSEALRRRFVEEHLLKRLPAHSMSQVDRVDVTPWTVRGTVVVRVWCKV